jgi:hypothetical protein
MVQRVTTDLLRSTESVLDLKFMPLHLFEFIFSCIVCLSEITCYLTIRWYKLGQEKVKSQDIPVVIRAHIVNRQNQAPPPLLNQMDPTMQQFFAAQTQLLQNLTATVQNLQAQ